MRAIELRGVAKGYPLHARHTTLKTALVRWRQGRVATSPPRLPALRDVTLAVERGRMLGVVGRNGSGKSTMLKVIAGILRPDAGQVRVLGRASALLDLGVGFHPEFSGRDNVLVAGAVLGLSRREIRQRLEAIVRFAELEAFIDEPVRTYSSGMVARLGFAVAVHTDPDVLLIDEILAVGDEAFFRKCEGRVAEFRRSGRTIVFVSHDLAAVERWCDEVVWLDEGRVRAHGPPAEVIQRYLGSIGTPGAATARGRDHETAGGRRWGTRRVEIVSGRILGPDGQPGEVFESGQPVEIEIRYRVPGPAAEATFGLSVVREDGLACYVTSTDLDDVPVPALDGAGVVRVAIDELGLIEGHYFLDVAVHGKDGTPFDCHHRLHPFTIISPIKDVGVIRLRHRWAIDVDR